MNIYQLERGTTADYASEELVKYIELMSGIKPEIRFSNGTDGIVLGLIDKLGLSNEGIEESVEKDQQGLGISAECKKRLEDAKEVVVKKMTPNGEVPFQE